MANEIAGPGKVFVCMMCGKLSRDRYGEKAINRGWDESCMLNAQLFDLDQLVLKGGRVVRIKKLSKKKV